MNVDVNDIKENDIITVIYKDYNKQLGRLIKVRVLAVKKDYFEVEEKTDKFPFPMVHAVYKKDIIMLNRLG
jgi:hypothetical protein